MSRYKFDRRAGLVDDTGKIILQLVAVGCSQSFRATAGKELANKLNGIEQGKEAAALRLAIDSGTARERTHRIRIEEPPK